MLKKYKFVTIFFVFVLLLNFQICFAKEPELNQTVDVSCNKYNIKCIFDEKEKSIRAKQIVDFTNKYNTKLSKIVFHLYPNIYKSYDDILIVKNFLDKNLKKQMSEISIEKVTVNGKNVQFCVQNQTLKLFLSKPIEQGEKVNIKIDFTLKIPKGRLRLGYFDDIYSLTNWYPILSIYDEESKYWDCKSYNSIGESNFSDVSDYTVRLILPKDMVIASTGNVVKETFKENFKIVDIKANAVRDFVFIMSKNYEVLEDEVYGIKIRNFYIPEDKIEEKKGISKEDTAKIILDFVKEAVVFFSNTFGKNPYNKIDVVETKLIGGAMEYPCVLQMCSYDNLNSNLKSGHMPWIIEAAVHETAHQWWYAAVGNDEYKEPFMDEALAQYSTALFFEKKYGQDHPQGAFKATREYISPYKLPPLNSSVDQFESWMQYDKTIYQRGTLLLEDLRTMVGEEQFIKILRTYYKRFLLKNGSIKDFLNTIEEICGENVSRYIQNAMNNEKYSPDHLLMIEQNKVNIER